MTIPSKTPTPPAGKGDRYLIGWFDGIKAARTETDPRPPATHLIYRCQGECGDYLEIGQAVVQTDQDAYGNSLWTHRTCVRAEPAVPADTAGAGIGVIRAYLDGPAAYREFLEQRFPEMLTARPCDCDPDEGPCSGADGPQPAPGNVVELLSRLRVEATP